jgi:NAD(P)-dependent dehydrogenase (short-subunit alcohol dehydrogenase family)
MTLDKEKRYLMNKPSEILITGADGGLGQALVEQFSCSGYSVVATTRGLKPQFNNWCKELQERTGHRVVNESLILEDAAQAQREAREIVDRNPGIDHFINNAAMAFGSMIQLTPLSSLRKVLEINLISQFAIIQIFAKHLLRKGKGSITNITSVTANIPLPGTFAYGSSKLALEYMTRVLALELENTGIVFSAVELGMVQTNMLKKMDLKSRDLLLLKDDAISILEPTYAAKKIFEHLSQLDSKNSGKVIRVEGEK